MPVAELSPAGGDRAGRAAGVAAVTALARAGWRPERGELKVIATADESSAWYVRSIATAAGKVGIDCDLVDLGPEATTEEIRRKLVALSADENVHAVKLQTPPPAEAPRPR